MAIKTRNLVNKTARALRLAHPVKLKIVKGDLVRDDWSGYHMLRRRTHYICVASRPVRGFYNVLAHEIAHALTDENYPEAEWHGPEFFVACEIIRSVWAQFGITLGDIYDPDLDV